MKQFEIGSNLAGKRLDTCLRELAPEYSRSIWKKLIQDGYVLVDGRPAPAKEIMKLGQQILVKDYENAEQNEFQIIYEDDDVLVINKPAGVLTHLKSDLASEATVSTFIKNRTTASGGNRAGIVHRLDRATSGVILTVKNENSRVFIAKQFANRRVNKWYLAALKEKIDEEHIEIDRPIARSKSSPSKFVISGNGKPAKTTLHTLQSTPAYSAVLLQPFTGRTHQLRVHAKSIGHTIIGDPLYSKGLNYDKTPHMLLHAWQLELTLPTNKRMKFVADIPDYMTKYLSDECLSKAEAIIASKQYQAS